MAQMREMADLVIVDSPPLAPMVDVRSMAAVADGVLVVVRGGQTRAPRLAECLRSLDKRKLVGAVVTDVRNLQAERAYGYYRQPRS